MTRAPDTKLYVHVMLRTETRSVESWEETTEGIRRSDLPKLRRDIRALLAQYRRGKDPDRG